MNSLTLLITLRDTLSMLAVNGLHVSTGDQAIKWFSFIVSSGVALFALYEAFLKATIKPALSVIITREVFFRILEFGESFYINSSFVSSDYNSLVTSISCKLCSTNPESRTIKTFDLEMLQLGEKFRKPDGSYGYAFDSTSPLSYFVKDYPVYKTIVFGFKDNKVDIQNQFMTFRTESYNLLDRLKKSDLTEDENGDEIKQQLDNLVVTTAERIKNLIQTDYGNYKFCLEICYKQKNRFLQKYITKKTKSEISFNVDADVKVYLHRALNGYLEDVIISHSDRNWQAIVPTYEPKDIYESI
jgi:hypothetical protein